MSDEPRPRLEDDDWRAERQQTAGFDRVWILDSQDFLVGFCDVQTRRTVACRAGGLPAVRAFADRWLEATGIRPGVVPLGPDARRPVDEQQGHHPQFLSARQAPARPFNVPASALRPMELAGPSLVGLRIETISTAVPKGAHVSDESAEVGGFLGRLFAKRASHLR